jgi:hypothetical protein
MKTINYRPKLVNMKRKDDESNLETKNCAGFFTIQSCAA